MVAKRSCSSCLVVRGWHLGWAVGVVVICECGGVCCTSCVVCSFVVMRMPLSGPLLMPAREA